MKPTSFRNRIALHYSIATAMLTGVVFGVIYFTVKSEVYQDLDNDLEAEIESLMKEIVVRPDGFSVSDQEWTENEHNTVAINPIFIEFLDREGKVTKRSPNLKKAVLASGAKGFSNSSLNGTAIRRYQVPVLHNQQVVGQIVVATPMEEPLNLLKKLSQILAGGYLLMLMALFAMARWLAGKSIAPVTDMIDTAQQITRSNLEQRIPLPANRDELYTLAQTSNALLDRIEDAMAREKQFTSDASHELRTPLAVVKGTLEVLLRKPRDREEYEAKVRYCLKELDRLNAIVDQLLMLARYESRQHPVSSGPVNVNALFYDVTARHSALIAQKKLRIDYRIEPDLTLQTDEFLLSCILDNLIENAVKYSFDGQSVILLAKQEDSRMHFVIQDCGIGIPEQDLEKIFTPFFRSRTTPEKTSGSGIGLSIVARLCNLLGGQVSASSKPNEGTRIELTLPTQT